MLGDRSGRGLLDGVFVEHWAVQFSTNRQRALEGLTSRSQLIDALKKPAGRDVPPETAASPAYQALRVYVPTN